MLKSIVFLCISIVTVASSLAPRPPPKQKVIVTGAAGRTGNLVFSSLLKHNDFYPVGIVRTEKSAKKLIKKAGCNLESICICDVTALDPNDKIGGLEDSEAMIICTSAVPKLNKKSLLKAFLKVPINLIKGNKAFNFRELQFYYNQGQNPEKVDYYGQIAQIDLAKKIGVKHVVLVSSMGGTNPNDFLNTLGRDKDGNGGDILKWKRKAEKYLINSGLQYTIIHPGGLKDAPGGELDFRLDVNDNIQKSSGGMRSITRCDVAKLCVAALTACNGQSTSFDCVNAEVPEGGKPRTAEMALKDFLQSDKVYSYEERTGFSDGGGI
jgi:uncharacterized protein YbjT (DUF2867 family)